MLKILIVWVTLLAMPLQGFASASMSLCAPVTVAAQHDHDHESMADASGAHLHDQHIEPDTQADHHPAAHQHTGKCAACATCCACVSMAPSFVPVVPVPASPSSITAPFDQHILPSVDLALPERPPRV
jgi:hypothetical protein